MKSLFITTTFFLFTHFSALCQEGLLDTIYFNNGKVEAVTISGFSENNISYTYPNEGIPISISNERIKKIVTRNGRVVIMENTKRVRTVFSAEDWEKVEVTGIESEVEGLIRIENVSGKADGATEFSSMGKMQDRAMTKMRMQAAFFGCDIVYQLSQTNSPLTMWATASSSMSGTAYAIGIQSPPDNVGGTYFLQKSYRLRPNDFQLKEYDVSYLNKRLVVDNDDFYINEDHYTLDFETKIPKTDSKMYLLKATQRELVFLVIDRSKQSKLKFYNLYFYKQ